MEVAAGMLPSGWRGSNSIYSAALRDRQTDRRTDRQREGRSVGEKGSRTTDVWERLLLEEEEVVVFNRSSTDVSTPSPPRVNK